MPRYSEAQLAAIKNAVDIVQYARESLPSPVERSGSNFKTLCPFHDDHRPSLILDPERRSFKCWSCGAGGDIFTFVKDLDRVDFPEAVRMLADRTGIVLESPSAGPVATGPSKSDLLAVNAWAEGLYIAALAQAPEVGEYVASRGISHASVERFRLGYAPDTRDWLMARARREGFSVAMLEQAGLIAESSHTPGLFRDRFRGRLIFPIHDGARSNGRLWRSNSARDRTMPWPQKGKDVAKYLNSSETVLFQKRRLLYAADLARAAARESKSVIVVEGYTDVIAAHQVGLTNVVAARSEQRSATSM